MPDNTPNLAIPHIATNQSQKEVTANTAFDDLDLAMTDGISINVAGSVDVTPTPSTVLKAFSITLTGTLTGNISLIMPANKKLYRIVHSAFDPSIGSYTVTVKVSGQPGVVLSHGDKKLLYCNGTDVEFAIN